MSTTILGAGTFSLTELIGVPKRGVRASIVSAKLGEAYMQGPGLGTVRLVCCQLRRTFEAVLRSVRGGTCSH
jgi:hypothetical protein